jgi:3-deoxy-D-manno-octulosonic-acid transferase
VTVLLDLIYVFVLMLASPWILCRRWRQGKRIGGFTQKFTGNVTTARPKVNQRLWLHAVSVGEVLLLKPIIEQLHQRYPHYEIYLSVTTATGRGVAEKSYPQLNIIWFPFDFSWAVHRAFSLVQPDVILLAELELWPNFINIAYAKQIPLLVVNGRIGEKSFQGYSRVKWLMASLLSKIDCFAVQQHDYAERLKQLGMPEEKIVVTGSIKFDGVNVDRHDPKVSELRRLLGIKESSLVWVVGSTQVPEEAWALEIYQKLKLQLPKLHLIIVPRHQERFEEVARLMSDSKLDYQRRSKLNSAFSALSTQDSGLTLIDTLGELKAIWGLADVGFVGGSFNDRGGQNMIEPAAYGVAVTFGPNTWNFKQIVASLLQHQAAIEVKSQEEWVSVTLRLLQNEEERQTLGQRASSFVASQQGATAQTMCAIAPFMIAEPTLSQAA